VKTALVLGDVPHETHEVNLLTGETQSEEFLKINKRGAIPVIQDGDFRLSESSAILKYLYFTKESIPRHLFPIEKRLDID